jgi:hypothetical protein
MFAVNRAAMPIVGLLALIAATPAIASQSGYIELASRARASVLVMRCGGVDLYEGRSRLHVRNLETDTHCDTRVAVFISGGAAQLIVLPDAWPASARDALRVAVEPPLAVPVHTWILYDPCSEQTCTREERLWSQKRVQTYTERANKIWSDARSGLKFENVAVTDRTRDPASRAAWDLGCTSEGDAARAAIGRAPNALNVYYVRETGPRGLWCEPDTILINWNAYDTTLAHEFGHALGLEHTEHIRGMREDNLMNGSGAMRTLTMGQVFRANFSSGSIVNRLGLRSGPVVECDGEASGEVCPELTLDLRPPPL